jgi:hypothetical protein
MLAHRVETTIQSDQTLILENLPFHSGELVEVIILSRSQSLPHSNQYSLRGTPIEYIDPAEPIAESDRDLQ